MTGHPKQISSAPASNALSVNGESQAGRIRLYLSAFAVGLFFFFADHSLQSGLGPRSLEQVEAGSPLRRIGFVALGLLGCLLTVLNRRRTFYVSNALAVILCSYLLWSVTSMIWADYTYISTKRLVTSILCFLAAIGICKQFRPLQLCWGLLVITLVYLCIGILVELPEMLQSGGLGEYRFDGTLPTNGQAVNCLFVCMCSFCLFFSGGVFRRFVMLGIFCFGLLFLVLTGTRGALYSLAFAITAYGWLRGSKYQRAIWITLLPAIAILAVLIALVFETTPDSILSFTQLGRDTESMATLTGRIPLWSALIEYVNERPVLGYGYQAFWNFERYAELESAGDWLPAHAHSAYMDNVLSLGLTGGVLFVLLLILGIKQGIICCAHAPDPGHRMLLMVLLMVPIYSLTESRYAAPSCLYSTVFFCALFYLAFVVQGCRQRANFGPVRFRKHLPSVA